MSAEVISLAARGRTMDREQVRDFLDNRAYRGGDVPVWWGEEITDLLAVTTDPITAVLAVDEVVREKVGGSLLDLCEKQVAVDGPVAVELVDRPGGLVSWRRVAKQTKHTVLACLVSRAGGIR